MGVTLHVLATGKFPTEKRYTGSLGRVIGRCTEFDPKRRYQTAAASLAHMKRRERSKILAAVTTASILLLTALWSGMPAFPKMSGGRGTGRDGAHRKEDTADTFLKLAANTDADDRIVYFQEPYEYPAILLKEEEIYDFSVRIGQNREVTVAGQQKGDCLSLSCTQENDMTDVFLFEDIYAPRDGEGGTESFFDNEGYSPQYEIVLFDLDGDGTEELLITLAWRKYIKTPQPENSYYLTAYSIFWVAYLNEENVVVCSQPLIMTGCEPSIQDGPLVYDFTGIVFYRFANGNWEVY